MHANCQGLMKVTARWMITAGAVVLLNGCGQKTETTDAVVVETNAAPVLAVMDQTEAAAVPTVSDNPAEQQAFAKRFEAVYGVYNPPTENQNLFITVKDGNPVFGRLVGLTPSEVTLIDESNEMVTVAREDLAPSSAEVLYGDVFAAALAEQAWENGDGDLQALLAKDPEAKTYPRILITDIPPLRYGPGNHFMVIDQAEGFLRGSVVHVLSTVGDWILVARSATAERGEGWLQSALTFSVDPSNVNSLGKEVENLKETGHLISVNIDRNEAVVDRYLWTLDTPAVQEGRSRLLAYYVGNSKDSRRWVDIVEQQTGRRIAQYSEAKGLRVY